MTRRRQVLAALPAVGATLLAGCSGGGANGTAPADPAQSPTEDGQSGTPEQAATVSATLDQRLAGGDASGGQFGRAVAVAGDTVLVGGTEPRSEDEVAVVLSTFSRGDGEWQRQSLHTVATGPPETTLLGPVDAAGDVAVVGVATADDPGGRRAGVAYVFERTDGGWVHLTTLTASDASPGDHFGAVSTDGTAILVGAPSADTGESGETGAAYLFERDGRDWSEQAKVVPADIEGESGFGTATALSGETALVGAPYDDDVAPAAGSAYVYERDAGGLQRRAKLRPPEDSYLTTFGLSTALDGETALVGAPTVQDPDDQSGSAYAFDRGGGDWSSRTELTLADSGAMDRFGWAVTVAGGTALVAAVNATDGDGTETGSVTAFQHADDSWRTAETIVPESGVADGDFGVSLAMTDQIAVVGAGQAAVDGEPTDGAAYVYRL